MDRTSLSTIPAPELPYLGVFYAVCAEGGFSAAARRLGCTQPSVSYQVRALEQVLETKLIERNGRRVLLTPAGERLRAFCHDFFGELARVRNACVAGDRIEPLRIGSASGFGRYVLVPALHRLSSTRTEGPFQLQVGFDSADVILHRLERGVYDAAFVYTRRVSNRLRYRAVYDEELVFIAAPSLKRRLKAAGKTDQLAAFAETSFVTYEESDYVFGRWFDANFDDQPSTIKSVAHFSELEEVIDVVRRGGAASIVPRDAVEAARARGEIDVLYAGRGAPCLNQVFMVLRAASNIPKELQQLQAALRRGG